MSALNWDRVVRAASKAFRDGVNDWLNRSQIRGGTERGPKLTSEVNFEADIFRAITAAGAPVEIARVFAGELWSAWKEWGDGFQISPTSQPAYPLKQSLSRGEFRLRSSELAGRLQAHLGRAAPPSLAIHRIAEWIDTSFQQWKSQAKLARPTGQVSESMKAPMVPIPSFAPMGPIPSFTAMGPIPTFRNNITTGTMMGPRFGRPIS
jgi:hypothetical protein